jgi:hypothetical protein
MFARQVLYHLSHSTSATISYLQFEMQNPKEINEKEIVFGLET